MRPCLTALSAVSKPSPGLDVKLSTSIHILNLVHSSKGLPARGCHDSLYVSCTHVNMATRLILHQLTRDVLTRAAGAWGHLPVILPVSAWRMGEERRRGGVRHSSVRHQPCRFTYRQQNRNQISVTKFERKIYENCRAVKSLAVHNEDL